jgi:NADPH:quinone reductase-like Zn-dependent oxidoreductase
MRAIRLRGFGAPEDVLELVDLPSPGAPASGEVLIGVEHAPINMNDLYLIQGAYPIRPSLPSFVGNEGVGRVLAIGRGVDPLKVGDRVLVPLKIGSWRERLVASAARPDPGKGRRRPRTARHRRRRGQSERNAGRRAQRIRDAGRLRADERRAGHHRPARPDREARRDIDGGK